MISPFPFTHADKSPTRPNIALIITPPFQQQFQRALKRRKTRLALGLIPYTTSEDEPLSPCSVDPDEPHPTLRPGLIFEKIKQLEEDKKIRDKVHGHETADESRPGHTPKSVIEGYWRRNEEARKELEERSDTDSEDDEQSKIGEAGTSPRKSNSDTTVSSESTYSPPSVLESPLASTKAQISQEDHTRKRKIDEVYNLDLGSTYTFKGVRRSQRIFLKSAA